MRKMLNEVETLMTPAKAEALAAELNAGGDGWKYVVNHDPKGTGYSFISIFDEDNEFVGKV
jgi:hypothetical protein